MSYKEIPNLLYSGKPVYVKSSVGGGSLPQVPMGVEGQNYNSPRSMFFKNIFNTRTSGDYTFYDENYNKIGQIMDIGQNPQTNNDSYFFSSSESPNTQKGQFDVIYYEQQTGGRRRKTRGRKSGKRRRTRRSRR